MAPVKRGVNRSCPIALDDVIWIRWDISKLIIKILKVQLKCLSILNQAKKHEVLKSWKQKINKCESSSSLALSSLVWSNICKRKRSKYYSNKALLSFLAKKNPI